MPSGKCAIDDCAAPQMQRGWCSHHYYVFYYYGDPLAETVSAARAKAVCKVEECPKKPTAKGYCNVHYQRWLKTGDPTTPYKRDLLATRTEKHCNFCDRDLPLSAFGKNRQTGDGLTFQCKECRSQRSLARRMEDPDWTPPPTPEERQENIRRIKREWKERNPAKRMEWDVRRRTVLEENYVEDVDPIVLADAVDWVCQLCWTYIDPHLPYLNAETGKPNNGYRTVDHIQALSRGGEHSYANTQIAHWICNVRKWTGERTQKEAE